MTATCDQCARLREALRETLELAERLSNMAEDGAGAYPNWGARVLQAVRPLRAALAAPSEPAPTGEPDLYARQRATDAKLEARIQAVRAEEEDRAQVEVEAELEEERRWNRPAPSAEPDLSKVVIAAEIFRALDEDESAAEPPSNPACICQEPPEYCECPAEPPRAEEPPGAEWRRRTSGTWYSAAELDEAHAAGFREGVERAAKLAQQAVVQAYKDGSGWPAPGAVSKSVETFLRALVPGGEK